MLIGEAEWNRAGSRYHLENDEVMKVGDLKFFECPASVINQKTWLILDLVDECTDANGNTVALPFAGAVTDQPLWYRQARKLVARERAQDMSTQLKKNRKAT